MHTAQWSHRHLHAVRSCGSPLFSPRRTAHRAIAAASPPTLTHNATQTASLRTRPLPARYILDLPKINRTPVPPSRPSAWQDAHGHTHTSRKPRAAMSVPELERDLAWFARNHPTVARIHDILGVLVQERDVRPTVVHYEALVLGQCDAEKGSVEGVMGILEEMEENQVAVGAGVYCAVLKVLSVHTDPILRQQVLEQMKRQWMGISVEARNDIIAGYIRENELEKAQDEMSKLKRQGHFVAPWLSVLLLHALGERRDFEGILRECYRLYDTRADLPRPLWLWLLQQAGKHGDYWVSEWVWQKNVVPMYITPDGETCVNILKICAKEGKHPLAESVHGVLEVLEPELATQHTYLVHVAYERAGMTRDPMLKKRPNMFALFNKASGDDKAFFDPKLALRKRPLGRFVNPRRIAKSMAYKENLKRLEKINRIRSRQFPAAVY